MNKLFTAIALTVTAAFSMSCGTTGADKELLNDVIEIGSAAVVMKYPQYSEEFLFVSDVIKGNASLEDEAIRELVSSQLKSRIPDPAVRDLVLRLLDRVITRTKGAAQESELDRLAGELSSSCYECDPQSGGLGKTGGKWGQ